MSEKRLFIGCIGMVVTKPGVTDNNTELFIGWAETENEARGAWVSDAFEKYPGARMGFASITDVTDIARADPN